MATRQRADERLADAADHQGDRETPIEVGGNDAVTLARSQIMRARGQLPLW